MKNNLSWLQGIIKYFNNETENSFTTGNSDCNVEIYVTGELIEDNEFMKKRFLVRQ